MRRNSYAKRRMMMEALEPRQLLTVITVTSALDAGAGSLREAITVVNANAIADTIQFASNVKLIKLLSPLPSISQPLTIDGPGAGDLTINGLNKIQIITIDDLTTADISVFIDGLSLLGGKTAGNGAAILNAENLSLVDIFFSSNNASGHGAAVYSASGNLTAQGCNFQGNKAIGDGGSIYQSVGALNLEGCDFSGNSGNQGGAVWSNGSSFTGVDLSFLKNSAKLYGGAICYGGVGALNLDGIDLISNSAGTNGGALWCLGNAASTWEDLYADSNKAKENGGAAWVQNGIELTVSKSYFGHNSALNGGAFYNDTTDLTWHRVEAAFNKANKVGNVGGEGGGLYARTDNALREVSLWGSSITSNNAYDGGGFYNDDVTTDAWGCAFLGNFAISDGGGVLNRGIARAYNCTFAKNKADYGGGFLNHAGGDAVIRYCTFVQNLAGSGLGAGLLNYFAAARVDSSLFWANFRGKNIASDIQYSGNPLNVLSSYNLVGDPNVTAGFAVDTHNLIGVDPLLLPLGDYGGPTMTYALPLNSPAIDAGINLDSLTMDQRGGDFARSVGGAADIGAFESEFRVYLRQLSALPGKSTTYKDANGKDVTVSLTGSGSVQILFDSSNLNSNPAFIYVYNTDSQSKINFQIKQPNSTTTVGDFKVSESINQINAPLVHLDGCLHVCGTPLKLTFGNVLADSQIRIEGAGANTAVAISILLGQVTDAKITSKVPISLLQVVRWDDTDATADLITAPRIDKLVVTGIKNGVAGDFEALLNITGLGQSTTKPVLGTVNIAGILGGGANRNSWNITGAVGTMTFGRLFNTDIDVTGSLKTFTIKPPPGFIDPVFIYSNLTVHDKLTTATLGKVLTDNTLNAGVDFGVSAHLYGTLTYLNALGTKITINTGNPPPIADLDFFAILN